MGISVKVPFFAPIILEAVPQCLFALQNNPKQMFISNIIHFFIKINESYFNIDQIGSGTQVPFAGYPKESYCSAFVKYWGMYLYFTSSPTSCLPMQES